MPRFKSAAAGYSVDAMKGFFLKRLILCLPLVALAACSVNPATGKQSFTAFMSRSKEIEVGREEHPKILKRFGGAYEDKEFAAYVHRVGLSLAKVTEVQDLSYTFTVLNDDKVNAFALPGGYVYITRGLVALAENEAEMAGVLAHEIGHITARHTAQRYSKAMAANIGLTILGVAGALPYGTGHLVSFGTEAVLKGYSRDQELEADMLGVRYLRRAGYDPTAMTAFFHKLKGHEKLAKALAQDPNAKDNYTIMSTHPRTAQRIAQAIKLAEAPSSGILRLERQAFLAGIDGMLFGDDPKQGVRKGREFAHPEMGFRFQVPPGFVLFNSPQRVLARGPGGAVIRFDMEKQEKAKEVKDLRRYLTGGWSHGLSLRNVERIEVNGLAGVTAASGWRSKDGGREDLRLIVLRDGPERIYRFIFLTPRELTGQMARELQRTTYSFRRLSKEEAAAVRPLRIRVVDVEPGDTVKSLAAIMPIEPFAVDWFELLNGVKRNLPLIPGTQVKIVTD